MMQQDYNQAAAYVSALTGEPVETAAIWWRCIHDTDKGVAAHKYYGTLAQVWNTLVDYNNRGYGIFCNINAFAENTQNHNLSDVWYNRVQIADLDNVTTAEMNYNRAASSQPVPQFAVGTSQGKFHVYWCTQPYQGNDRYNALQRKIRQVYDGDKAVIDPTRVLRVPGFYHLKNPSAPYLVTCWSLGGFGGRYTVEQLEQSFAHVNVVETSGGRTQLGDPKLAAPSIEWLQFAMTLIDPNDLDRAEWISATSAFKQAGFSLTDETTLFNIWSEWCARYAHNDAAENLKQWNSIRDTEVGWNSLKRRAPVLNAYEKFGFKEQPPQPQQPKTLPMPHEQQQPDDDDSDVDNLPDILTEKECQIYFKNCYFVEVAGKILNKRGRFMNATQFNGAYGGKLFVIDITGKVTDEPWKAATRSTLWTVPKVDHVRFLPEQPSYQVVLDQLGRRGLNTYVPIKLKRREGDITPWLRHMENILPVENDRNIFYSFIAHNLKFPGFKIPWAPLIQSTEGVGKGFIQAALERVVGDMYMYSPKAEELVSSGSKFNAWMRGKLMIIVNEVKVDERRDLIEILKPMISDKRVEIQGKGENQEMEDNPANWLFFTNYKDAIPVTQNGRRWAVFYSAIQSASDLLARGMDDNYFTGLFMWLENGGSEILADWLLKYPIERGQISMRAPETSSQAEAVKLSRGAVEIAIANAVEDQRKGFMGGYISTIAVMSRLRQLGGRLPARYTIERVLEQMGYHNIGRAVRPYAQEDMNEKTTIYALFSNMSVEAFGKCQGYE